MCYFITLIFPLQIPVRNQETFKAKHHQRKPTLKSYHKPSYPLVPSAKAKSRSRFYVDVDFDGNDNEAEFSAEELRRSLSRSFEVNHKTLCRKVGQPPNKHQHQRRSVLLDNLWSGVPKVTAIPNVATAFMRLYFMTYFPSGFWSRLITRLLGDGGIQGVAKKIYGMPKDLKYQQYEGIVQRCRTEWQCWQTGLELHYVINNDLRIVLLRLKEAIPETPYSFCDYQQCKMMLRPDMGEPWTAINIDGTVILEIILPNESILLESSSSDSTCTEDEENEDSRESVVLHANPMYSAKLLSKVVDCLDTLLEDWYPDLGIRFAQNSYGMYLITRAVPCTRCILSLKEHQMAGDEDSKSWSLVDFNMSSSEATVSESVEVNRAARTSRKKKRSSMDGSVNGGAGLSGINRSASSPGINASHDTSDGGGWSRSFAALDSDETFLKGVMRSL